MGGKYLDKQKAVNEAVFDAAQEIMLQFDTDIIVATLRQKKKGRKAIDDFLKTFEELHAFYIVAFNHKHPEADYRRELLDRVMRDVYGDEAVPFEERQPMAKEIRYDKPQKSERPKKSRKRKKR